MSRSLRALAVLAVLVLLGTYWNAHISGSPIEQDGGHAARMAVNLAHHGVVSLETLPPYSPSMYREPLPVLATAFAVQLIDAHLGPAPLSSYLAGERARLLKLQNVLWFELLALASFIALRLLVPSFGLALTGSVTVALVTMYGQGGAYDSLYSEHAGAALSILASVFLVLAWRRGAAWAAAAGAAFGLLALTKAAALYVFAGLIVALGLLYYGYSPEPRRAVRDLALLVTAFAIVVLPWVIRNYHHFGTTQIAERGGVVLMVRALKNEMTAEEYRGAFYVWTYNRFQPLVGAILGFSEQDLQRGGRLQRLNRAESDFLADDAAAEAAGRPEDAISFYRQGRAERVRLTLELAAAGHPEPGVAADAELRRRALEMIRERPFAHLAATLPFLWRGARVMAPTLVILLLWSLWSRRPELAVFVLPAGGTIAFYALLSHFIPRYCDPAVPVAMTGAIAGGHAVYAAARARLETFGSLRRRPCATPTAADPERTGWSEVAR